MKMTKAHFLDEVTYEVVMTYGGAVSTERVTFNRVFYNYKKEEGEDWEFIYAMHEDFEDILKLKQGEAMPFKPCRDSEEWGLVLRIK